MQQEIKLKTKMLWLIKRRSKVHKKNMSRERTLTNHKRAPKTMSQWEFDYGLITKLATAIVAYDFSPCSLKLGRGILPPLTN